MSIGSRFPAHRTAFTLIELLVVIAIISLLISILLPSLQGAKEQGKKAVCLSNLRSLGTAMMTYSAEDEKQLVIPIHHTMKMFKTGQHYWLNRTVEWFSWGGRSAPEEFLTPLGNYKLNDNGNYNLGVQLTAPYAAKTRPLNLYLYQDLEPIPSTTGPDPYLTTGAPYDLRLYECPSDRGYPDRPSTVIDDAPQTNAERRLYDTIGNSYRASLATYGPATGWRFSRGPWGQPISGLVAPSGLLLLGEPTFFNMIGTDDGAMTEPDPVVVTGWHNRVMMDNLLYADGHAETTSAWGYQNMNLNPQQAADAGQCANWSLTGVGTNFRITNHMRPGVMIRGNLPNTVPNPNCWPFAGYRKLN